MKTFSPESKTPSQSELIRPTKPHAEPAAEFINVRPEAVAQRKLQDMLNQGPGLQRLAQLQATVNNGPRQTAQRKQLEPIFGHLAQRHEGMPNEALQSKKEPATLQRQSADDSGLRRSKMAPVQRQEGLDEEELLQGKFDASTVPTQAKNRTGMPGNLKAGIESLSGLSMDDVQVHYGSSKPAQLNALAYAQGTDIHLGPGQEQHLPHEAWHVVQQKQGRVKPTMQMKGKVHVNDDAGLEKEADVMGALALSHRTSSNFSAPYGAFESTTPIASNHTIQTKLITLPVTNYLGLLSFDWRDPKNHGQSVVRSELATYFRYFVAPELFDSIPVKRYDKRVDIAFKEYSIATDVLRKITKNETKNAIEHAVDRMQKLVDALNKMEGEPALRTGIIKDQPLPPHYDAFCDLVLANYEVMNSVTEGLDEAVYDLYSGGTHPDTLQLFIGDVDDAATFDEYYVYWKKIFMASDGCDSFVQATGCDLKRVIEDWKRWFNKKYSRNDDDFCRKMESHWRNWSSAFVYIQVSDEIPTYRVYANVTLDSVGGATETLIKTKGVCDFKFAGPASIGGRSEGLVVYCKDKDSAQDIARTLNKEVRIVEGRPNMTESVTGTSGGLGIGAEPASVATGMRKHLKELGTGDYDADVQSFGMIRSELIASAILHYRWNRHIALEQGISEEQLFKRFVAIGLNGWETELDPTI